MSKYTTEVRFICETLSGLDQSVGYNDVEQVISNSREKIFDFDYPVFDENYRSVLETKILKHYYTREIGFETLGLWKLKLNTKLNEIMPYYNQLYKSELLEFNPFYTTDITRERTGDGTSAGTVTDVGGGNNTVNGNNGSMDKYSDTPQGSVANLEEGTYLTNARQIANTNYQHGDYDNSNTNTRDLKTTDHYIETLKGTVVKDKSELLIKFRKTFLNIDMMIIKDLEELFLQLW